MKITALEIDGYGVWSGLRIQRLADGLSVVYGPNEAGKSTLLQFIRSVLYGFSPERRRYFPPVHGGRPGGRIEVSGPNGSFQIDRHDEPDGQPGEGRLVITAADGTRQGEHMIRLLLSNLDEPIFNNVFAVGLREIQELGALGDTEAAELLYGISAGLDRVSLVEVMRELETSRNRILDRGGGPCLVAGLLADREKLRQEIEELESLGSRYGRLAAQRSNLDRDVMRLEEERNAAQQQLHVIELAIGLRDRWIRRAALDGELSAMGPQPPMPPDGVRRLDVLAARFDRRREALERLDGQRKGLRREAAGLEVNAALARQAARIEALLEQEPWLAAVEGQAAAIEKDLADLGESLAAEWKRLGLGQTADAESLGRLSPRALRRLRGPARSLEKVVNTAHRADRDAAAARDTAGVLGEQIEAALRQRAPSPPAPLPAGEGRSGTDLAAATDRAGSLVAQLRRRIQVDERLDQMTRYEAELDQQSRGLLAHQILPVWLLAGLGTVFVLGLVLLVAGVFMPASMTGPLGWALALLGLAGIVAAAGGKILLERSGAARMDACQKQLHMLRLQIKQAKEEREGLDVQLPRGGGPIAPRLAAAEQELSSLEALAPLETRHTAARQEAAAAADRAARARTEYRAARRRWREALEAAGLPADLTFRQVRRIAQRSDEIRQIDRRMADRREELAGRRRELEMLTARVSQLVADCGVAVAGPGPIEQLRQLADALGQQRAQIARREAIRRQLRDLRRQQARQEEAAGRLRRRRQQLLRESGAGDEQEFRRRAVDVARAQVLRDERDALDREIAAAAGEACPHQALRQQLEGDAAAGLEVRGQEARTRLTAVENDLRGRIENRGQLIEQMRALAEDRRLVQKQLDMAVLQKRLEEAVRDWQVKAIACRTLETIRTTYEQERQPETLREASDYLGRLTQGRYRRVWTPLGQQVLRVDDADGHSLGVEVLSRGTREQLFLSLRLALAACYARRGAPLPLVLDDVLVNFDADRARAAAAVLRDFAAAGHQLLVFTCHEHIAGLFKSLRAPVASLPENTEAEPPPIIFEDPAREKPKRSRRSSPPRKAAPVKRSAEPEEEVEPPDSSDEDAEATEDEAFDAEDSWQEEDEPDDEGDWQEEASDEEPFDGGDIEAA
ncbi:MAG: AAA family ATPase [Thermoguttaceae bacterium]